ncbi:hypothetical protein [Halomonas sp. AOP43-D1-4]|uniref:hypothetical protein n=1 Tax=Halomonas sp. AOP43-D1-4 TaxID=3457658 RepID=UPI0040344D04
MKLNEFLHEHSEWIASNVPGKPPFSDVKIKNKTVSSDDVETIELGEDPHVTINGKLVSYSSE